MSKIFRLYKEGTSTYTGWNESPAFPYNSTNREGIDDPDGASARNEITSIPSPFARIDLVKNAFREVCTPDRVTKQPSLDGNTVYHKMVSDTLDVGEIFFNIDKYSDKVEIITWDAVSMIEELKASEQNGHHYLADALSKYLLSDTQTYNFGQLRNIYLLNYVNGPDELNIIGATSPATLFFCTANELDYVSAAINFGQDRPFDKEFQPLYKRDFEYIKSWFVLRKTIPNFATLFPELESYLTLTLKAIDDNQQKNVLKNISPNDKSSYSEIEVKAERQQDAVEVLGYQLYKRSIKPAEIDSDFIIESSKEVVKPLVLPIESGNKYSDLHYTTDKWGKTNAAPCVEKQQDLNKRILPFDGLIKPYLTISDLLEENIVRIPHRLNKEYYFDGNIQLGKEKLSYLLPLKSLFFTYFSAEDLLNEFPDGKNLFEMEALAGNSVKVTLRVPIKGSGRIKYIEYSRIYYNGRSADIQQNEGGMCEFDFTAFIMPNVRFNNPNDAVYTVSCISTYSRKYTFSFYNGEQPLSDIHKDCRNTDNSEAYKADVYSVRGNNFEYIQIASKEGIKGIILPKFKEHRSIENFEFAIDLGTSNTHVEFQKNGSGASEIFNYDAKDELICSVFVPSFIGGTSQDDLIREDQITEKDFLPKAIGKGSDFHFPTRTVLSCAKTTDWQEKIKPFGLVNVPLSYDKRRDLQYNNLKYNIKWGKGDNQRVMESYIDCLMLMMRNKVLLNNGDLRKTRITWFYPLSMPPKRLKRLRSTWDDAYNRYFSSTSTNCMTESSAPIQYFFRRYATATNLVNVDIGGGTTDIAFAKEKEVQFVTSFRFASNALFENSFSDVDVNNGIVDWHKRSIQQLLEERNLSELLAIFNSENNVNPSNMASFLFSLKDNSMAKGIDPKCLDFNYILQDDEDFKIVFILFYTAIIYHIAHIVKAKGLEVPRHISFSGNGSKVIKVVSTDSVILAKYTKLIFEKVIGCEYDKELEILGLDKDSNPKESTCKGGLLGVKGSEDQDKIIILKATGESFVTASDTYDSVDDAYIKVAVQSIRQFFDFTLNTMNEAFNFDNNFGVSRTSLDLAKTICYKDLDTYLKKGLAQRKEESEGKDNLEETLFFYPIKGVLNALSQSINEHLG